MSAWRSWPSLRRLVHDATVTRFGETRLLTPVQWPSENDGMYTALGTVICAKRLGLALDATPACSHESNGMAEAFVHARKREYFSGADLSSVAALLEQLPARIVDYNGIIAPHSALGYRAPQEYRQHRQLMVTA